MIKRIIICPPINEYFTIGDRKLHNIIQAAEINKAIQQHENLRKVLSKSGCEVTQIPELAGHPNSVFTRDTSLMTPQEYIKLRMGLESRRGEEDWMAQQLESLGIKRAGSITGNGTVEGGDVILGGNVAFVGRLTRTNKEGVNQISAILNAMNFEVRFIEVPQSFLHLGGAMSILSHDDVLYCQGIFPVNFFDGLNRIEVPVDSFVSGNVISLGNHEIFAEKTNTAVINILEQKMEPGDHLKFKTVFFDLEKEEYSGDPFDIIYSQMVLHHIKDINAIFRKFYHLLTPGGILAIADLYQEDGSFHDGDMNVHRGFDPEKLISILRLMDF